MSKAEWTEISTWKFYGATSNQVISGGEEGWVPFKVLRGVGRPRGPIPYPFV